MYLWKLRFIAENLFLLFAGLFLSRRETVSPRLSENPKTHFFETLVAKTWARFSGTETSDQFSKEASIHPDFLAPKLFSPEQGCIEQRQLPLTSLSPPSSQKSVRTIFFVTVNGSTVEHSTTTAGIVNPGGVVVSSSGTTSASVRIPHSNLLASNYSR